MVIKLLSPAPNPPFSSASRLLTDILYNGYLHHNIYINKYIYLGPFSYLTHGFYMFVPWIIAKDSSSDTLMLS